MSSSTPPAIDGAALLRDLQKVLGRVEAALHAREGDDPAPAEALRARYAEQTAARRTALAYASWRDDYLTQVAAAWVLSGVFIRYVEDNGWVEHPWLASADPGERLWA